MTEASKQKVTGTGEGSQSGRRLAKLEALKAERRRAEKVLRRAYDELEQQVKERTRELLAANEQLKQEIEVRRRAEEELKKTKDYLENVIDNSVDAIGIVDRRGRFILWNRRAAEIYGYANEEMAGKSAFELYPDADELARMLERLRRDGVVREYEIQMRKKEGVVVPMDISISLLKNDRGETIGSVCVARDLSERKKAELELKRARDELRRYSQDLEHQVRERTREITSILKYTPAVIYIKDKEGRYKLVNARFEELFGVTQEDIQGKSDYDLFPKSLADQVRAHDLQVFKQRRPLQVEERFSKADGPHTYLTVKFPLYNDQGSADGLCGIATDITELKRAQEQLRLLSGNIMAGQEKERRAIARELHDELGQVLTALRLEAVWLYGRLQKVDAEAAARALTMCELIDKTIDEVRGLATRLRPGVLDDLGLIEALEWYTAEFHKRTGIACTFHHNHLPPVDNLLATAAYRIAQEALTNVARHAFATQVKIALQVKKKMLYLTVRDNGRGFDPAGLADSECLGLAGMRERANLAGGCLQLHSQPGKGTLIAVKLPLTEAQGARHD